MQHNQQQKLEIRGLAAKEETEGGNIAPSLRRLSAELTHNTGHSSKREEREELNAIPHTVSEVNSCRIQILLLKTTDIINSILQCSKIHQMYHNCKFMTTNTQPCSKHLLMQSKDKGLKRALEVTKLNYTDLRLLLAS